MYSYKTKMKYVLFFLKQCKIQKRIFTNIYNKNFNINKEK